MHGYKIDVELLVEAGSLPGLLRGLQDDGAHCEGDEVRHCRVYRLLVELWGGGGEEGRRGGGEEGRRGGGEEGRRKG